MQIRCKAGSLKDQDPISKISKINFASWIKGFCRHLSHLFFFFRGSGSEHCYFQNSFFWKSVMSLIFCLCFGPQPFPLTAAREPFFISKILSTTVYVDIYNIFTSMYMHMQYLHVICIHTYIYIYKHIHVHTVHQVTRWCEAPLTALPARATAATTQKVTSQKYGWTYDGFIWFY